MSLMSIVFLPSVTINLLLTYIHYTKAEIRCIFYSALLQVKSSSTTIIVLRILWWHFWEFIKQLQNNKLNSSCCETAQLHVMNE